MEMDAYTEFLLMRLAAQMQREAVEKGNSNSCTFMSNKANAETKSARVQLIMQPSVLKRAKAAAQKRHISLNEYVNRLIMLSLIKDAQDEVMR